MPYTKRGCPVNYAAGDEAHIIETEVNGGPTTTSVDVDPLRAGKYIFCAWADPSGDNGLDPEATTAVILDLTGHHASKRPKHKAKKKQPKPRGRHRLRRRHPAKEAVLSGSGARITSTSRVARTTP